jgi:capsular polysaccharide transport system permease protein
MLLNPSVHCFEMVRAGFFGDEITTHYDPVYLTTWCVALTILASATVYHARNSVQIN